MTYLFGKEWGELCLYHSRFFAKANKKKVSKLCIADKLACCLIPNWLFLFLSSLSGELEEYMDIVRKKEGGKYSTMNLHSEDKNIWLNNVKEYLLRWVEAHKDGSEDTWTPDQENR